MKAEELYNKVAGYCAQAERCRRDVRDKLRAWDDVNEETLETIVRQLEDNRFLDEKRYAVAFANDKLRFQHWGRMKIRAALMQKGVGNGDIEHALEQLDPETYRHTLEHLAETKRKELCKETDAFAAQQKLSRFLLGRGFTYEEISGVLR